MSIPGTIPVTGILAPTALTDTYPITDPKYGIDGLRNVVDYTERNNIPADRRREGMVVGTISTGEYWKLKAAPWAMDNTDWDLFFDLSSAWVLNGNTVGATRSIGTIDDYDFPFITNNIERLRVLKSGEIGINTVNPLARLHVKGAGNTSATTAFRVDSSTVDNNFWVRDDGIVNFKNELWRDGQRFLYANPNSTTNNLFLGHSSGNVTLTANENVGIGFNILSSISSGSTNIGVGVNVLSNITNELGNTALGRNVLSAGSYSVAIGQGVLFNQTTGSYNYGFGVATLASITTGVGNIGIGYAAGNSLTTANYNIAIGYNSLVLNTTGQSNIAIGSGSSYNNVAGNNNVAIGIDSFYSNTNGVFNVAIGSSTLKNNTTGNYNIVVGGEAMFNNTTGYNNVAIGLQTLYLNTTGHNNTALGYHALFNNQTGQYNVAIGARAGFGTVGVNNVFIGWNTGSNTNSANNSILIGSGTDFTNSTYTSVIGIGVDVAIRESNIMVVGSDSTTINKAFLGRGQVSSSTSSFSLSIHGIPGSNVNDVTPLTDASAAANIFFIDGSRGTGTGRGGNIIFRTANAGTSGNVQNTLTEVLKITDTQSVFIKTPLTAPADGDFIDHGIVNTPQFTTYLDEPNNFLYFKVKYSDGSFKEGRISLS